MSGVLPPILGGERTGFVDSRPTSNTSVASTTYTSVPHIFYNNKISDKQTGVSKSPRRFDLPSLRHSWAGPAPNPQDVESTYSARYRSTPTFGPKLTADTPFLPKPSTEDCMKCLLKIKHKKCESHKYVRIGGGYRHGYWYVKCLLEELEIQRHRALIAKQRLEAIHEKRVRAVKTYIRTKSGKLVERIVFLSEEDYQAFKEGKNAKDILKKYLSKDEAQGLQKWDKDEVKAIKTYVRTKSGRVVEKLVYVSSKDYDAIKDGKVDANKILKKYVKTGEGEEIQGWGEAKMKQIKTYVRTKSGKLIEKTIMISQEDYDAMIKDGKDPEDILKKYIPLDDGQKLESWKSSEPMKAIKTKVRTKSGRIIEKTIFVSQDDYDAMTKGGGDANKILSKYLKDEDGVEVESWEKADTNPMKVVKTYIRTKSGRVIEKDILLTEDEYRQFQETGGDPNFLKKFVNLNKGEEIEDWEKASTVYSASDDADIKGAKHGQRIVGKDGNVYEVVVDPLTGKKYKKKVGMKESDVDSGIASLNKGRKGRKGGKGGGNDGYDDESPRERTRRKQGKRDEHSDSEYSYRSVVSAGGRRHVKRRKKLANGTYASDESYHSSQDEEGAARRRRRRRERRHGADSAHSYYSVKSAGGTRHVKRRRKKADGTYSASESYHSSDSDLPGGGLARKGKKKKKHRVHGSDSEHSYFTDVSEGGTKTRRRKKRIKDKDGKVIGYASSESYSSDSSEESSYESMSDGKGGRVRVKKPKLGKGKDGRRRGISKPVFSDASTDSDAVDLENMTEEEKEKYFKEKAIRKAEREKRRREKYGDKYDEMLAKHEKRKKEIKEIKEEEKKQKEERRKDRERRRQLGEIVSSSDEDDGKGGKKKKTAKSMVTYDKGSRREILDPIKRTDSREPGLGPEQWGGKKGRQRKNKDGHEADDESDEDGDSVANRKRKQAFRKGSREDIYEYKYDKQGRIIGKTRRKHKEGDGSGSEYEYEYDEKGNLKQVKRVKDALGRKISVDDTFEVGDDGKLKLKPGKKKIDINKLSRDDLERLGIDPNLSKKEIAKLLKEKFGDDIKITDYGKPVGTKHADDYSSGVDTDDLAEDDDLDVDTLVGARRVKIKMKRGGQALIDHMKLILQQSRLPGECRKDLDEKGDIDFLAHYHLVKVSNLEGYARAFVCEDEDMDTVLTSAEGRTALEGVPGIQKMTKKQLEYCLKVLKIDEASQITFRMFAVMSALAERVTKMDPLSKHLLQICDLLDIQRKMDLYKSMFYCNAESERNMNFIKAESLRIELIAGGLNWKQQHYIMERLEPNFFNEISFLDYICYIPLFLSMHDNICDNPLDNSTNKFDRMLRRPSGATRQRDMNPMGQPLKRNSSHLLRKQAQELLEGRIDSKDLKKEKIELLHKYSKLPKIIEKKDNAPVSSPKFVPFQLGR